MDMSFVGSRGNVLNVSEEWCSSVARLVRASSCALTALLVVLASVTFTAPAAAGGGPDLSMLGLSPAAERAFLDRGFVVVPGEELEFVDAYAELAGRGIPAYITTDSVLYITDVFLDRMLLSIEEEHLYDRLIALSREMVRLSEDQYLLTADDIVKEGARRNMAYFAVGLSLLDPDYFPPESVISLVERELALIQEARGVTLSPIMGVTPLDGVAGPGEDYSRYAPQGHYAGSPRLERFHRALTWYSRMAFALPEGRVEDFGLTIQALLIVRALESEAGEWLELWARIHEPLNFYTGGAGDPTVLEYADLADDVFGEEFDIELLSGDSLLQIFVDRVSEVAPPHYETHELRGMRFLSPWFFPDTAYFALLPGDDKRAEPTAIDMLAHLGSSAARTVLEERDRFDSYSYQRWYLDIERRFEALTYGDWTRNLYWSWQYALKAVLRSPPEGAPAFMTTEEWGSRMLSTGGASWALHRHTPPSRGLSVSQDAPALASVSPPYVEPYPDLYVRLRELLENLRDRLWEHYLIDDRTYSWFSEYCVLLTSLERVARTELEYGTLGGAALGLGDHGASLRRLAGSSPGGRGNPGGHARSSMAFAIDAYKDFTSGRILEVAVGVPDLIYVLIDEPGGPTVYGGAILSYYEYEREDESGLLGDGWHAMLRNGKAERPHWVDRFLIE
jgi:hypothetical protein